MKLIRAGLMKNEFRGYDAHKYVYNAYDLSTNYTVGLYAEILILYISVFTLTFCILLIRPRCEYLIPTRLRD
jgi:hypothetical protein